jgi:hypothetical protein
MRAMEALHEFLPVVRQQSAVLDPLVSKPKSITIRELCAATC